MLRQRLFPGWQSSCQEITAATADLPPPLDHPVSGACLLENSRHVICFGRIVQGIDFGNTEFFKGTADNPGDSRVILGHDGTEKENLTVDMIGGF